jgi:hypothetical protein
MDTVTKKYVPHSLPKRYKKSRVSSKKFNKRIKENNEVLNKAKNL